MSSLILFQGRSAFNDRREPDTVTFQLEVAKLNSKMLELTDDKDGSKIYVNPELVISIEGR